MPADETLDLGIDPSEEARSLLDAVWQLAEPAASGGVAWFDPWRPANAEGKRARIGHHLHSGAIGVALAFAAGARLGDERFAHRARLAFAPVRRTLRALAADPSRAAAVPLRLGAFVGIGSLVYGSTVLARLLDDEAILDDALFAASLVSAERIESDEELDLTHGSAGSALALLRLEETASGAGRSEEAARCLEAAIRCGEHLLATRRETEAGPRAWPHRGGPALAGFSHGVAGISHALLALHRRTLDESWRAAALEAWAWERALFDPSRGEWRDLRDPEPRFTSTWCHGAPGIALSRLAALDVAEDEARSDLEPALASTRRQELDSLDHLCCGNFGRAEILARAAERLDRDDLRLDSRRLISSTVTRAKKIGHFAWIDAQEKSSSKRDLPSLAPALMAGAGGIAWVLIRRGARESLPDVQSLGEISS